MGIARRTVEGADLVITVWDGEVTASDWSEAVRKQLEGANTSEASLRLTDARTADASRVALGDVDAVSTKLEQSDQDMSRLKLAIVVNAGWNTAQRVETTMRKLGTTTVVFDDVHAACAWLGVDPDMTLTIIDELRRELRGLT